MAEEHNKQNREHSEEHELGEMSHRMMEQELAAEDDDINYHEFTRLGKHPAALYVLFLTEMWERFSYYGMRALLVLYLTDTVTGLSWTAQEAGNLYGWYTMLVYITPLAGGWLADRYFGYRSAVFIGGILMMAGHLALAFEPLPAFYLGLGLLILGNGFFKPNISSMVGQLYPNGSPLKDSAYTIFYMGINLGAFTGTLVCGYLGESPDFGWHWGFGAAGVGMGLGLIQFFFLQSYLKHIGLKPKKKKKEAKAAPREKTHSEKLGGQEIEKVIAILVFAVFSIVFWFAFEQAGSSMNLFARDYTDRYLPLFDWTMPASWFQSFNAAFIIFFAPVLSSLWVYLGKIGLNPTTPIKFVIGFILVGAGFWALSIGSGPISQGAETATVSMWWLIGAYWLHTLGELCLSPTGLAAVNKLSPPKLLGLMFGVWFFAAAIGNKIAGSVAGQIEKIAEESSMSEFFMIFVYVTGAAAVLMLLISPLMKKWMHGEH